MKPIVICAMEKTGNSTIIESLHSMGLAAPIFDTHFISEERYNYSMANVKSRFCNMSEIKKRISVIKNTRKKIVSIIRNKECNVITMARDPIVRNISNFFSGLDSYGKSLHNKWKNKILNVKDLTYIFLRQIDHELPLIWFDQEIKEPLGIDVFQTHFPSEKGYKIYKRKNVNLMVITLEKLSLCANEAFKKFLGIDLSLTDSNLAEDQYYIDMYRDFLKNVRLPRWYIKRMYESKLAKHFYSKQEIDSFIRRWR